LASEKHPERNEDAFFVDGEAHYYGVFDGMGGHAAGDKASRWAVESITSLASREALKVDDTRDLVTGMQHVMMTAHTYVATIANSRNGTRSAGTTGIIAKITPDREGALVLCIVNVGDSRAALLRNGNLYPLTLDDSYRGSLEQDEGNLWQIQEKLSSYDTTDTGLPGLDARFADVFRNGNIVTQALGRQVDNPRAYIYSLKDGDRVLLLSDGITDNLTSPEMLATAGADQDPSIVARSLCASALAKSRTDSVRHKSDDMTAVVIAVNNAAPKLDSVRKHGAKNQISATQTPGEVVASAPTVVFHRGGETALMGSYSEAGGYTGPRTLEELFGYIEGLRVDTGEKSRLYTTASSIFRGDVSLNALSGFSTEFREGVTVLFCRFYARTAYDTAERGLNPGLKVFESARLGKNDDPALYRMLDGIGGLWTRSTNGEQPAFLSAEYLKALVRDALGDSDPKIADKLTRTHGLRATVKGMIQANTPTRKITS